jgi:hypothetical protein
VGVVVKCGATKRDGSPCSLPAQGINGLCWAHDPANADTRRKGASRGGRSKAGSELHSIKQKLIQLGDDVLARKVDRGNAAVAATCYGTAIKAVEAEVKVRELQESRLVETKLKVEEQQELVGRLEELEERIVTEKKTEGRRWGA